MFDIKKAVAGLSKPVFERCSNNNHSFQEVFDLALGKGKCGIVVLFVEDGGRKVIQLDDDFQPEDLSYEAFCTWCILALGNSNTVVSQSEFSEWSQDPTGFIQSCICLRRFLTVSSYRPPGVTPSDLARKILSLFECTQMVVQITRNPPNTDDKDESICVFYAWTNTFNNQPPLKKVN